MEKTMKISGMSCMHCKAMVEKVLNALPGVEATAVVEDGAAYIKTDGKVTDEQLIAAVRDNTAFEVKGIE